MANYAEEIKTLEDTLKDKEGFSQEDIKNLEEELAKLKAKQEGESNPVAAAEPAAPAKKHAGRPVGTMTPEHKAKMKAAREAAAAKKKAEKAGTAAPAAAKKEEKKAEAKHGAAYHKHKAKKAGKKHGSTYEKHKAKKAAKKSHGATYAKHKAKKSAPKRASERIVHLKGEKSIYHRIDNLASEVEKLKPEIAKMEKESQIAAEKKLGEQLRKALAGFHFAQGGTVKGTKFFKKYFGKK